jgi:tetratricopeptide (TPR) repeat protein
LAGPYNNSGNLLASLGRHEEALAQFQLALSVQPDRALAHYNLGTALGALNRHEEAVAHYRKALAERPDYPAALNNLGNSLHALVRPAESLEAFERLVALDPGHAPTHFGVGNALQVLGRVDEARQAFERAAALAPGVPLFHRALVETKRLREDDPQLAIMENLAQHITSLPESEQIELHFALAKANDDIGRTERAFEHLQDGNMLKRRSIVYDERAELGALRAIERVFTSEMMGARRGLGDPSEVPVFILGMPRSGTTLVEQILASHPRVFGAGEMFHLPELISAGHAGARFPSGFSSLSGEQLRQFGSRYVERLQSFAPEADRIADKLPANFRFAGLIHLVLPKARIIHVRRDPVDTCFSCYTKLFPSGQDFTFDLGELGRYYRAYESLIEHWRSALPAGVMLEVQYETLVADLEGQARRMIEYSGLQWDERCLRFYETERSVRTASFAQVHKPLYGNSIGRWRPYRAHLRLLLDTLGVDID